VIDRPVPRDRSR